MLYVPRNVPPNAAEIPLFLQHELFNISRASHILEREAIIVACTDETTAITTGTAKVTFRMPFAFVLEEVRASLTTAQASGNIFTVDINASGATLLSTKITIDNTEKTSTTAATLPVISSHRIVADAEVTVDVDQIGASGATGLKITLIGTKA